MSPYSEVANPLKPHDMGDIQANHLHHMEILCNLVNFFNVTNHIPSIHRKLKELQQGLEENYLLGNDKACEEIPCRVKGTRNYKRNLKIRTYSYDHHSIVYQGENCEELVEKVVEELCGCPLISNHWINYNRVHKDHSKSVWDLYSHLKNES